MPVVTLWQTITSRFRQDAAKLVYAPIPKNRTDVPYKDEPLAAGESYFRIWLTEMFLTRSRDWFTAWHPAVHCSVKLSFNNQAANFARSRRLRRKRKSMVYCSTTRSRN